MLEKLKVLIANEHAFTSVLVILAAVASFGLGRASVLQNPLDYKPISQPASLPPTVRVFEAMREATATTTPLYEGRNGDADSEMVDGGVVASKSGTRYHLPTCPGASQIKPDNRIVFPTRSAAEAAGYTPAANCPGL